MKNRETWDDRYGLLNHKYLHYGVVTITTAWIAGVSGPECVILVNAVPVTVTLPLASVSKGKAFYIKKITTAVGAVTIAPSGADTIDGVAASISITSLLQTGVLLVSDGGTGWWIIADKTGTSPF